MPRWAMKLPKRPELWVLLALVVAGLAFVFVPRQGGGDEDAAPVAGGGETAGDPPLKLHRAVVERDYGNVRLDLELRVQNSGGETLVLQSPKARLLTGKGREIPGFFLPFEPQPEVPANATQDVQLRFWLDAADLQEALRLEVAGAGVEVKSARPFDLNGLKNAEKKVFNPGAW